MSEITAKTPWKEHLGEVPFHQEYGVLSVPLPEKLPT